MKALVSLCLVSLLGTACTSDEVLSEETAALSPRTPILIQPGEGQILLAVTEDNYAVYQQGQALFATKLAPGSPRLAIGSVPGTNVPLVLQLGKVVFIWTNPQRGAPGLGVSPLVLWTAAGGAQLIAEQSSIGLVATAASSDSKQILFTKNVTADNARGDLVHALTSDPLHPTTLLANTTMAFPNGRCRPLANFGRDHGLEVPVAQYCAGTDMTATMSKWVGGVRTDLISNIVTPLQFVLESDPQAETFLVNLANSSVATVTLDGNVTVVDAAAVSGQGFIGRNGAIGYAVATAPPTLRLARPGRAPETVSTLGTIYLGSYNRNGYSKPRTVSPDGSLVLFGSKRDPVTRQTDMNLLDIRTGAVISLHTAVDATAFSEVFTSDGSHALFFTSFNPSTGTATLVTGNRRGGTHAIGPAGGVWDALAASGDDISFTTNPTVNGSTLQSFFLSTGDLYLADAGRPSSAPVLVSAQASLIYLPSFDRTQLVFQSSTEPRGPGLYVAQARL